MPIDRRDLESPKPTLSEGEEKKLREAVDIGNALTAMTSTYGWKLVMEKFIKPRTSYDALVNVKDEDLHTERAAHRALYALIQYIERGMSEGQKAYEKLLQKK